MEAGMPDLDEQHPPEVKEDLLTSGDRALLDLNRAQRALGRNFDRQDPRAAFYLKRAKVNALLELARAIRGEPGSD
jgi:hypothetical protein